MKNSWFKLGRSLVVLALVLVAGVLWSRREPTFDQPTAAQLQRFFAADTRNVFEKSATWTLFSIEPRPRFETKNSFRGHKILKQIVVSDAKTRARLQTALYGAIADSDGTVASCFNPHHALRATYKNQTVDLILCFSCGTSYFYVGEKRLSTYVAVGSRNTEKIWDRVLENAK